MRRGKQIALVLALSLTAIGVRAGDVIDRIVATVNGQPILQSQWEEAIRMEAFLEGRPLSKVDAASARATLDRVIDRELLHQQLDVLKLASPSPEQVTQRLREVRQQLPEGKEDASWQASLKRYGLSEDDVRGRLETQLELLRVIDMRLRPNVRVDAASVEAYYRDKLLPQIRQQGGADPPLVEVSPKIEELLSQQGLDELLTAWLADLRKQSDIRLEPSSNGNGNRSVEAR